MKKSVRKEISSILAKSLFVLLFSVFAFNLSAQVGPTATGNTGNTWDYCQCVPGTQSFTYICPCAITFPPNGTSGGTSTGNNGNPSNSSSGSTSTSTGNGTSGSPFSNFGNSLGSGVVEFFTLSLENFCEQYPQFCGG